MIDVQDVAPRVPANIYRYEKLNEDGTGTGEYLYLRYAPGDLIVEPTTIDRKLMMAMQGLQTRDTVFNDDGTIDEVSDTGTLHTAFNSDGSITETFTNKDDKAISMTTTFNSDGSISTDVTE
jgi:hypothetical protein